jgi:uncharacterized protein
MNGAAPRALAAKSRGTVLAFTSSLTWLAAAAIAGPLSVWPIIGGIAVVLGVAVLLFDHPATTALLKPRSSLVLLGATAGAMMVFATFFLYPLLARSFPFIATDTAQLYTAFRMLSPVVAALALVPVIVGEELVWRGVVQASLVRRFEAWKGVTLAAAVYALVHAPFGSPVLVVVAFFCGLAWGTLRATTGSLVPTLVAHLLWDVVVLLWLPLDP